MNITSRNVGSINKLFLKCTEQRESFVCRVSRSVRRYTGNLFSLDYFADYFPFVFDGSLNSIYWFRAHIKKTDNLAAKDVKFSTNTMEAKA